MFQKKIQRKQMVDLPTTEMIKLARIWLSTQTQTIPRDILQSLYEMSVSLLGTDNPPNIPPATGELIIKTEDLLPIANKFLDGVSNMPPKQLLIEVKNQAMSILQQLPKWRCSMFFPKADGDGVDSSLGFASIDRPESNEHRRYTCDAIRRNGGDTLLFIAEKMFDNPALQNEVGAALEYAVGVGMKHLIVDLKNDNNNLQWHQVEAYIKQMSDLCALNTNSDQVAFMTCLETDEILSLDQTRQMVRWCKQYAPLRRVIVGSQSVAFLQSLSGCGCELWYEIRTDPFDLTQADADQYISDLQSLLPYGFVWAGEYWSTVAPFGAYISKRALEIGCAGIGSFVN